MLRIWQSVVEEVKEHVVRKPTAATKCMSHASKECKGKKGDVFKSCRKDKLSKCLTK